MELETITQNYLTKTDMKNAMTPTYKLLQRYPSLPNWVKKGMEAIKSTDPYVSDYKIAPKGLSKAWVLRSKEVENNPDFWQKVEQDNFEILTFKFTMSDEGYYYEKQSDGTFLTKAPPSHVLTEEDLLKGSNTKIFEIKRLKDEKTIKRGDKTSKGKIVGFLVGIKPYGRGINCMFKSGPSQWLEDVELTPTTTRLYKITAWDNRGNIHTAKRLSDGNSFSVLDWVEYLANGTYTRPWKITGFFYKDGYLFAENERTNHLCRIDSSGFRHTTPLLKTNDGVDIYRGQCFWDTRGDSWKPRQRIAEYGDQNSGTPKFSTREAAEKYIYNHKPLFSRHEIQETAKAVSMRYGLMDRKKLFEHLGIGEE